LSTFATSGGNVLRAVLPVMHIAVVSISVGEFYRIALARQSPAISPQDVSPRRSL
jgi:hypothetical protein